MKLETQRMQCIALANEHLMKFHSLTSNQDVCKYMKFQVCKTMEETQLIFDEYKKNPSFALFSKEGNQFLGIFAFKTIEDMRASYSISAFLSPQAQGKGYMKELFALMIPYARVELHAKFLDAYILDCNLPSMKLVEAYDFTLAKVIELPDFSSDLRYYQYCI